MNPFKKTYYAACSLFPTSLVQKISPSSTLLPYHHLVSDEDVLHVKHLYKYKNIQQFTADLDVLLKHTKPVSAEDIITAVKSEKKLPDKSFLLTFDDGFSEVYHIIAPILTRKGVPAIFFINPAFVDNKELFYRCKISLLVEHILNSKQPSFTNDEIKKLADGKQVHSANELIAFIKSVTNLNKQKLDDIAELLQFSFADYVKKVQPFLTTVQLHSLAQQGFAIGSHSWDHPYYRLISHEEKLSQTISSGNYVAEQFHQPYKLFSFPHSDSSLSQTFFNELTETWQPDLLFGIQNQKYELDNKMLHRFNAERPDLSMKKQLNGILLFTFLQQITGKNKVLRTF